MLIQPLVSGLYIRRYNVQRLQSNSIRVSVTRLTQPCKVTCSIERDADQRVPASYRDVALHDRKIK